MSHFFVSVGLLVLAATGYQGSVYAGDRDAHENPDLKTGTVQSHPIAPAPPKVVALNSLSPDTTLATGGDLRPALKQLLILFAENLKDTKGNAKLDQKTKVERIESIEKVMKAILSFSDNIEKDEELKKMARISLAVNICVAGDLNLGFLPLLTRLPAVGAKAGACITVAQAILPQWPHLAVPIFGFSYIAGGQIEGKLPDSATPLRVRAYAALTIPNPLKPGEIKYRLSDLKGLYTGVTADFRMPKKENNLVPKTRNIHAHIRVPELDLISVSVGGVYTDDPRRVHPQLDFYYYSPFYSTDETASPGRPAGGDINEALSNPEVQKILKDPDALQKRLRDLEKEKTRQSRK